MKVAVNDLLGKLQPEEEHTPQPFRFSKGILAQVNEAYEKAVPEYIDLMFSEPVPSTYERLDIITARRILNEMPPIKTKDIQEWHNLTHQSHFYQEYESNGSFYRNHFYEIFLTALCEKTTDDGTLELRSRFKRFGREYSGNKVITLIGNIDKIGKEMQQGVLIVKGPVVSVGLQMSGGILAVEGEVISIGQEMTGGIINVIDSKDHPEYPTRIADKATGGTIYLNNKPVYPRPK